MRDRSDSESVVRKKEKKVSSKTSDGTSESDLSVSYESSDSSSSDNRRKKKKNKKKKSGIKTKASDTVHFTQKYPQAYLRYEFTSSNISFDKLDFNLFIAGELEIISSKKIKEVERSGRLNLLKKIMYLNTGCLKKRGPFLKLVKFIFFSRNLSKILYGHNKMILLCSEEESIYSSTSIRSDVIMTSD